MKVYEYYTDGEAWFIRKNFDTGFFCKTNSEVNARKITEAMNAKSATGFECVAAKAVAR